jgi:hypothetical protein
MTRWWLSQVMLFLGFAAALAGIRCKSIAEEHRQPGQHWFERYFGPAWLEFYTPKGQFHLRLSRWFNFAAFVMFFSLWFCYVSGYVTF